MAIKYIYNCIKYALQYQNRPTINQFLECWIFCNILYKNSELVFGLNNLKTM